MKIVLWRGPTLPGAFAPSTIGAGGLNFRVRDGNGCDPSALPTRNFIVVVEKTGLLTTLYFLAAFSLADLTFQIILGKTASVLSPTPSF